MGGVRVEVEVAGQIGGGVIDLHSRGFRQVVSLSSDHVDALLECCSVPLSPVDQQLAYTRPDQTLGRRILASQLH